MEPWTTSPAVAKSTILNTVVEDNNYGHELAAAYRSSNLALNASAASDAPRPGELLGVSEIQ